MIGLVVGLMVAVGLAIALFIAVNWQADRSVEELSAKWAKPPSTFIDVLDMHVHLRDEGVKTDPNPIVLIHGTSSSLHTWDGWTEALKQSRRVIRFDIPAFGLTGPAPDHNYTIENYARFVIAVMDELQVEQAVLAGNSLGGYVAWATGVLYPERVTKLGLVDTSGYPFKSESVPLAFKIASTPVLNKMMEKVLPRSVVESSVYNVYGDPSLVTPALIDRYFELTTRAGNRQALAKRFQQTKAGDLAQKISTISQPTLILWGGQDRLIPPYIAEHFDKAITDSELVMFETLGHVPHEEAPEETVAAFIDFLNR